MLYSDYYLQNKFDENLNILDFKTAVFEKKADVSTLSKKVDDYFQTKKAAKGSLTAHYNEWKEVKDDIREIANQIVPIAEKEYYGCNLFVDKIYIYRSTYISKRAKSWVYHYDNNPPTVLKLMVYLTDVTMDHAPLEVIPSMISTPSRLGPGHWGSAPNNSRIPDNKITGESVYSLGDAGTTTLFYPNVIHRPNIPAEGLHRDMLTIRVRPCKEDVSSDYLKYTTSYEKSGACPSDPKAR